MIGATGRSHFRKKFIRKRAQTASIKSLSHAAAALRLVARRSIKRSQNPSQPNTPPHTRRGQLKRAILYAVDKRKQHAVIGPDVSKVGQSAMAHEYGGKYRKQRFPRRPFMGPALLKIAPRLPRHWSKSIT